jgi:hypothetical protein
LSGCRLLTHPFRQRAGLVKTSAREQQPDLPFAWWRQLVWSGDGRPRGFQRISELRGERRKSQGRLEKVPELIAELIASNPEIIVTS